MAKANSARDQQNWPRAAAKFRRALQSAPDLTHIWVQLGNMEKEQGLSEAAELAYLRAAQISPADAEPLLQLGHLFNLTSEYVKAGEYYLRAFQTNPRLIEAATALHRTIGRARGKKRQQLIEVLKASLVDLPDLKSINANEALSYAAALDYRQSLVFDVSDLINYFAHGRSPTGIQRVQIEVIGHALARPDCGIFICCFIEGRDDWLQVPDGVFKRIVALSLKSSEREDLEWIAALHQLHLRLTLSPSFKFPTNSILVNLGSSWQLHNYFLFVRDAKVRYGIHYVPFVHDLIPVVAPEHFTKSARQEVVPWVFGVFTHADHILVNSEATRKDLLQTGAVLGQAFDPANISVIHLDADYRSAQRDPAPDPLPESALARWQLGAKPFILLVSTVESRKGHATAFNAWAELIGRHGPTNVPTLVCVGKKGWLSDQVYQQLDHDTRLKSCVKMLSAVSDAELSLLYRTCLFTVYPSLYEGWGLPITEALCYAKPVIASNTSSLPEAGGDFAVYVEAGSAHALAAAVERMWLDASYRQSIESRIKAEFRPRSWSDLAEQITVALGQMPKRGRPGVALAPIPVARMGAYHSIARSTAARIWPGYAVGEAFRTGTGWSAPSILGSWTNVGGGTLTVGIPSADGTLRIGLLLLGALECDVDWTVTVRPGQSRSGWLGRSGRKWVIFDCPVTRQIDRLGLHLQSKPSELAQGQDPEDYNGAFTIGLAGFFLYRKDDVDAGMRLLEAVAFGNLDDLDPYAEHYITISH